ncbi:gamma-crystallin D-like [Emydura macquarii macquarii]|uniref:gamma-crystallin D-like n=1 Tax=Emydura macquarii macquarii TaxID=1129001 RepID=UPI00352AC4B8
MANSITFHTVQSKAVTFSEDQPDISDFTVSTVNKITVAGDPWVIFDTSNYGGDFYILKRGQLSFPNPIKGGIIQSMRRIKGGIGSSQVNFYPQPFYKGPAVSFDSDQSQLDKSFFSLQVDKGAVVFYDEEQFGGENRILLNGDKVENFTAVKLTYIGRSMKIAKYGN